MPVPRPLNGVEISLVTDKRRPNTSSAAGVPRLHTRTPMKYRGQNRLVCDLDDSLRWHVYIHPIVVLVSAKSLLVGFCYCFHGVSSQAAQKEKASQGRVVAVGEGRTTSVGNIAKCPFKPGDFVKFLEYAPTEIKVHL